MTTQPVERPEVAPPRPSGPTAPDTTPVSRHRSRRRVLVAGALLVIAAVVAVAIWRVFFAAPALPPGIVAVSGRIEGDDSAVGPKVGGRILEVTVREGDSVAAGAVIALLDDTQVRAREQQAEAMVRQAEARLAAAEAQLAQAEASHAQAKWDRDAFTNLFGRGLIAEQQARQAQNNEKTQAAVVVSATRQVAAARADLDRTRAQLAEARADRNDLRVVAPFAGTVATRTAEPGEVVTAGTPIITLIDLGKVYLRAFVPEGQIGALNPVEAMPAWLQPLTLVNPIHHFAAIVRGSLLKGSGLPTLWPNVVALLLFTLVLVSLSIWRFRKQLS